LSNPPGERRSTLGTTAGLNRQRLAWVLAVPVMVAGSFAAHSLTAVLTAARSETGSEAGERHAGGSPAGLTLLLGFALALLLVVLWQRALRRRESGPTAATFVVLPALAFLASEVLERLFGVESFPFQPSLEPRLLLGLALQLPFGLVAFFVARLLLGAVQRVVARLSKARFTRRLCPNASHLTPRSVLLPRIPALALGYPERGPPARE